MSPLLDPKKPQESPGCAVPISARGNRGWGIAPWHAALTDSDVVTVGDTPVTVERVMLLRPVMSDALVSSCLIHKVDDGLATDTHDGSSNNHVGCDALCHCRIE